MRRDRLLRASLPRDAVGDRRARAADGAVAVAIRLDPNVVFGWPIEIVSVGAA
jgi:hypothetical protein